MKLQEASRVLSKTLLSIDTHHGFLLSSSELYECIIRELILQVNTEQHPENQELILTDWK